MGTLRRSKQRTDAFLLAIGLQALSQISKRVQREPVRRLHIGARVNSGVLGTIFLGGGGGQWAINQYAPL
jgi:hypothetical protein